MAMEESGDVNELAVPLLPELYGVLAVVVFGIRLAFFFFFPFLDEAGLSISSPLLDVSLLELLGVVIFLPLDFSLSIAPPFLVSLLNFSVDFGIAKAFSVSASISCVSPSLLSAGSWKEVLPNISSSVNGKFPGRKSPSDIDPSGVD